MGNMKQQADATAGSETLTVNRISAMSEKDMKRVAEFIDMQAGIQLPMSKQALVEGRLRKRMEKLGFNEFRAYLNYALESTEGEKERLQLVDVITTNKTDFFREPQHFDYLINSVLPEKLKNISNGSMKTLNVWSAGCSTGEEAYTLSMVLAQAQENNKNFKYSILATDISHTCLRVGSQGIYTKKQIAPVSTVLRKKYLLKSRNPDEPFVQMGPEIRTPIRFDKCNLMDRTFSIEQKMDVIFCRNVMIYFNNETKHALVNKFENQLMPGGYLFVGHAESLSGMQTNMKQVSPMVYFKKYK